MTNKPTYAEKRAIMSSAVQTVIDFTLALWKIEGQLAAHIYFQSEATKHKWKYGETVAIADCIRGLYCDAIIPELKHDEGSWIVYPPDGFGPIEYFKDRRKLVERDVLAGARVVTITEHLVSLTPPRR